MHVIKYRYTLCPDICALHQQTGQTFDGAERVLFWLMWRVSLQMRPNRCVIIHLCILTHPLRVPLQAEETLVFLDFQFSVGSVVNVSRLDFSVMRIPKQHLLGLIFWECLSVCSVCAPDRFGQSPPINLSFKMRGTRKLPRVFNLICKPFLTLDGFFFGPRFCRFTLDVYLAFLLLIYFSIKFWVKTTLDILEMHPDCRWAT